MKLSENWLREWVNPPITREEWMMQLTMAGLEVESCLPVAEKKSSLSDYVFELKITPNRGDCLSIRGIAREVALFNHLTIHLPALTPVPPVSQAIFPIKIDSPVDCPRYVGRVIHAIRKNAETPLWMQEKLLHCGLSLNSPVVDVTNYVLLELGQPLHAFDLDKLEGEIVVRKAKSGESLTLLDNRTVELDQETLVIADAVRVQAIAGIMGGTPAAISADAENIFLESAFFTPSVISKRARRYGLSTDSSYRFERGVDPSLQVEAIERATQLLLDIVGGVPGPIIEKVSTEHLPTRSSILLRRRRISQLLGITISDTDIQKILNNLQMQIVLHEEGWQVTPPSYRFDIAIEADLIEEIARVYGYNNIPNLRLQRPSAYSSQPEKIIPLSRIRQAFIDRDYYEAITYSFVDPNLQGLLDPEQKPLLLVNALSPKLSVMRTNLWPGLIDAALYNQNRQQQRVRFFETGTRFIQGENELKQEHVLSGLVVGNAYSEQWGIPKRSVDFFDVKNDLEAVLRLTKQAEAFVFLQGEHPALHPGQCSKIVYEGKEIGYLGRLHPSIEQKLEFVGSVFLFELLMDDILVTTVPRFISLSKFPSIRRDIAFLVNEKVTAKEIQDLVLKTAGQQLRDLQLFDVYQGKGIPDGEKSLALSLILQHPERTLVDTEVTDAVNQVISALKQIFRITVRE